MNIILYAKYGNRAMRGSKNTRCLHCFMSFLNSKLLASVLAVISINGFSEFVNEMLQTKIKIFKAADFQLRFLTLIIQIKIEALFRP
jgi:hypothetical protein